MAISTFEELQSRFWDSSASKWRASMWWQSANTVEALCNLALAVPSMTAPVVASVEAVFDATTNPTIGWCDMGVALTFSGYFDDEAWWGLAWLRAHTLTGEDKYLLRSRAIFDDLVQRSWSDASCGGGCCWQASRDPGRTRGCCDRRRTPVDPPVLSPPTRFPMIPALPSALSLGAQPPLVRAASTSDKNAVTNELFFSHAAQLATRYRARCIAAKARGANASAVFECAAEIDTTIWAHRGLQWFLASGMINGSSLVNDGVDTFPGHGVDTATVPKPSSPRPPKPRPISR